MGDCVLVLNGAPRSGKSSIAAEFVEGSNGGWVNLGVDTWMAATPPEFLPGIGLRPGGERPDLEPFVQRSYSELFDAVGAAAHAGTHVVVDVGMHDAFSRPLGIRADAAARLAGLDVLWVGVQCDLDEIVRRRERSDNSYLSLGASGEVATPVRSWSREVHRDGGYDVEVDTSELSAHRCAVRLGQILVERFGRDDLADTTLNVLDDL